MYDPSTAPLPMSPVDVPKNYSAGGKIMLCAIIILFAVVLTVLCLHIYARWYLRRRAERRRRERRLQLLTSEHRHTANKGLDPAVLKSIPVFTFTGETPPAECAVCLCEFEEEEEGRTLPGCKHSFHLDCIDMWFFSHNTCPLCRSSVEDAANDSVCIEMKLPESSVICDLCRNDNVTLTTASSSSLSLSSWISNSTPVSPRVGRGVRAEETSDLKSPAGRIPLLKSIINRDLRLRRVASAGDLESGRQEAEESAPITPRMQQPEP